ncbi:MAG: ACP S-malonyltransferase [Firmicutes bacterium]|nr:ACP S-malonyltransferase [Bacillota bacterium]
MNEKKVAIAFPGQGVQKVGMADFVSGFVEEYYVYASQVLGYDLLKLCNEGPEDKLKQTVYAQPAIFVTSLALYSLVKERFNPAYFLGHSLGEVTAMVASEAISFQDGVKIVAKRAELMEKVSADSGGMLAIIGLDSKLVNQLCLDTVSKTNEWVQVANLNSPEQIVVSGQIGALNEIQALANAQGAKRVIPLNVSGPFHSKLMEPAAKDFKEFLDSGFEFRNPIAPVISNGRNIVLTTGDEIKQELVLQLTAPVLWVDNIELLERMGIEGLIECSLTPVLSGFTKRIGANLRISLVKLGGEE